MFLQGKILPAKLFLTYICAWQVFWDYFSARYTKSVATPALYGRNMLNYTKTSKRTLDTTVETTVIKKNYFQDML